MRIRILATILLLISFVACTKDPNTTNSNIMSAYVGNSYWYATRGNATVSGNGLTLSAYFNNTSYFSFSVDNYTGAGTYPLALSGFTSGIFYDGNGNTYRTSSGVITITSDNGSQVMGTFGFSGLSDFGGYTISVTGGQFTLLR